MIRLPPPTFMESHVTGRALSNLVFSIDIESRCGDPVAPQLILLHDRGERLTESVQRFAPLRRHAGIVAVEASKGVWHGKRVVGYTWFMGDEDRPAPLAFGGSLEELEAFLLDTLDRRRPDDRTLPYLAGAGQGGTMALSLAAAQPDRISGAIAIDALFPDVPGWNPPLAPIDGLPVLVVDTGKIGANPSHLRAPSGDEIVRRFAAWGADARTVSTPDGEATLVAVAAWLAEHPPRFEPSD